MSNPAAPYACIEHLIEAALRCPEVYTPRKPKEYSVAWQARAVKEALIQKGIIK